MGIVSTGEAFAMIPTTAVSVLQMTSGASRDPKVTSAKRVPWRWR